MTGATSFTLSSYFLVISAITLWNIIIPCLGTDDYDLLNQIRLQQERRVRSQPGNVPLDGLYSIQSAKNQLYLTARNGYAKLGPVVLRKWSDSASQLWDIKKFDTSRGYNLKPLANEFNVVTSSLENNAHSYNAWEFKKQARGQNTFVIFNALNRRCLQASETKEVKFNKCEPEKKTQHWKINKYA